MLSRFRESESILQPALHCRNQLCARWLATKCPADLGRFHRARAEARQAIRATKNAWFQDKAEKAHRGFGGKTVWKCIRAMQYGRRGLRPARTGCIRDEVGNCCTSQADQHQRWQRHFTEVLNVRSKFEGEESPKIRQHLVRQELNEIPAINICIR